MTRLEHRARTWALSAMRRWASAAEAVLSPALPVVRTCAAPAPTVSAELALRLERGELAADHAARDAHAQAAEAARKAALLASLERSLDAAREQLDTDRRPTTVVERWLEVAS